MKIIKKLLLLTVLFSLGYSAISYGTFYFDGKQVPTDDETVSYKPEVSVVVNGTLVSKNAFSLYLDDLLFTNDLLTKSPYNFTYDYVSAEFIFQLPSLSRGSHTLQLKAVDDSGGGAVYSSVINFFVASDEFTMRDDPIIYPSPATFNTFITYELTAAEEVKIYIYDLNGQIVFQEDVSAGSIGAQAGYNAYPFDLKSSYGNDLPNGVYVVIITQRDEGKTKILGKKKFIILREDEK
jgi:hypothetical protein